MWRQPDDWCNLVQLPAVIWSWIQTYFMCWSMAPPCTYIGFIELTHWGWVTHICVGNLTIIGSDNGLSPGRHQAIIWTNAGIVLIRPMGTNFSEISIKIHIFSFKKMHLKMSSGKWRPFCLGLNVLIDFPTSLPKYRSFTVNEQKSCTSPADYGFIEGILHRQM